MRKEKKVRRTSNLTYLSQKKARKGEQDKTMKEQEKVRMRGWKRKRRERLRHYLKKKKGGGGDLTA